MSRTGALSAAELELVEVEVEFAELCSPPPGLVEALVDASNVVWAAEPIPLENPVESPPPLQAVVGASTTTAARRARIRPAV
jgi:hypothetical protein